MILVLHQLDLCALLHVVHQCMHSMQDSGSGSGSTPDAGGMQNSERRVTAQRSLDPVFVGARSVQMDHGHGAARRSHSFLSLTALSSCVATVASCGPQGHNEHRQLRAWRVGRKAMPPLTLLYALLLQEAMGDRRSLVSASDGMRARRALLRGRAGVPLTLCGRAPTGGRTGYRRCTDRASGREC